MRPPEHMSSSTDHGRDLNNSAPSTIQVSSVNQVNLTTKVRSKRKMDAQKPAIGKDIKSYDIVKGKFSVPVTLFHDRALNLKVTPFTLTITVKLTFYNLGFISYMYFLYDR